MSIEKYIKNIPDYTIPNTSGYSTDGGNLRCYKLGNAGDTVGYDWCFATNYNDIVRYENTILGTSDSLETNKNGYITEDVDSNLYFKLNKTVLSDNYNKLTGGLCAGILYVPNDVSTPDIHNCYVIENLDFNRVLLKVTGYGTVNNPVVAEKINIDTETENVLNAGYLIEVNILNNNMVNNVETIGIRYVEYFISEGEEYIKPYYINARELQPNSRDNTQTASVAYTNCPLSKPYYREQDGLSFNVPFWGGKHHIVTTMYPSEKYKLWEELTRTTPYYNYYAAYATNHATVKDLIHLLNSSGIRYYDSDHTTIEDIKNNVFLGVMDENGVTDCNNRIKGWDEIEQSDLPNKDRNGYDWENQDPTRPPIDIDTDDTEKMNIGGYYTAGGLVNYYSLVNTPDYRPLDMLSDNLSSWDYVATGKDVLRNLVSLKAFPIARELLCRGTTKEIVIAGTQTGVNGQTVDSTYSIINLGSISIPHRYNDFRDYAPYTKIELCCPFVGWLQLPAHCMGHKVTVQMTYDIITGSCTVYVVLDDNTIVAQACGCIAYDIPFTAESVGMKTAGMITGITGVASSALSLGTGLVSGNIVGSASGIIGLANSVTQTICANNANYTETKGTTGDSNSFAGVKQCYLKITYPISHIPENYGESVGYIYNRSTTLERGMGFTKTSNTKITGTMFDTEQNEIKSLMELGVIL